MGLRWVVGGEAEGLQGHQEAGEGEGGGGYLWYRRREARRDKSAKGILFVRTVFRRMYES